MQVPVAFYWITDVIHISFVMWTRWKWIGIKLRPHFRIHILFFESHILISESVIWLLPIFGLIILSMFTIIIISLSVSIFFPLQTGRLPLCLNILTFFLDSFPSSRSISEGWCWQKWKKNVWLFLCRLPVAHWRFTFLFIFCSLMETATHHRNSY